MAQASIKIGASMSEYQSAMKAAVASMKELSSQYSLAAANAKLYGTKSDALKAKISELTQKMDVQKTKVADCKTHYETLTTRLDNNKKKSEELKTKVAELSRAYEESKEATGENSEETKKLKTYIFEHEADFVIGAEVDVHVHLAQRFDGGGADLHADLIALEVFGLLDGGVLGDDDGLMDFVVGIGEHIGLLALVRDGHAGGDDVGLSGFERREDAVPRDVAELALHADLFGDCGNDVAVIADDVLVFVQELHGRPRGVGGGDERFLCGERGAAKHQYGEKAGQHGTKHGFSS